MSLPTWNGAESVYGRLRNLAERLNKAEYTAQSRRAKGKALKRFTPSGDADAIIAALNRGDEEECKAFLATSFYVNNEYLTAR